MIKSRLRAYEPFLTPLLGLQKPAKSIDLGCGRGEWLELTSGLGFDSRGVDLDDGMLLACRELGLNAAHGDALEALRELSDESIALVSAFHVVEHLPFDAVRQLVKEAYRVLTPGGILILETPNPENLVVGATNFYLDPTHIRPIPPLLLSFTTEHAGFLQNKVVRLQDAPELKMRKVALFDVLEGVSPDYGVVAQKEAPPEVLELFNPAFTGDYGVSLDYLARRYDHQADARAERADARAEKAEIRAEQADARARQADTRAERADARAEQADARAAFADAHAKEAEQRAAAAARHLQDMLSSTSWRITAPLRLAGAPFRRITSAIKENRIMSGTKRRVKAALRMTAHAVVRHPTLKHGVIRSLDLAPPLRRRLRALLAPPLSPSAATVVARQSELILDDLSPDAQVIYRQLQAALKIQVN